MTPCRDFSCGLARRGEPYTPDQCPRCWSALHVPALAASLGRAAAARVPLPCDHEGDVLEACQRGDEARHVRECDVHGRCTRGVVSDRVRACVGCGDYAAYPPVRRTHLAYHLLPVAGRWRRLVDRLVSRWDLFTGRKVVTVATGGPVRQQWAPHEPPVRRSLALDAVDAVRAALPADAVVIEVPNDPARWEGAAWPLLWPAVLADAHPDDAVLYLHGKGVTRAAGGPADRWADILYALALDHWDATARDLTRRPVSGPLRKPSPLYAGRTPGQSLAPWHYSGNVWWARAGELRAKLAAHPLPADPWAPEAFVGRAWPLAEAGSVWSPGGWYDLYRPADVARVEREFAAWAAPAPAPNTISPAPVRLSVIVPTRGRTLPGRRPLARVLADVAPQLTAADELLVIGDASDDWGATPRTTGMRRAAGTHLVFLDDDDAVRPGALDAVRRAAAAHPGRPLMFRMRSGPHGDVLPRMPGVVREGNVSTQMFVTPRDPARLGDWGKRYAGDFDFIRSTLAKYPPNALVWCDDVLTTWRPTPLPPRSDTDATANRGT